MKEISTYHYVNNTTIQCGRGNQPGNDSSEKTDNGPPYTTPLVCLAPSHAESNGYHGGSQNDTHESLQYNSEHILKIIAKMDYI